MIFFILFITFVVFSVVVGVIIDSDALLGLGILGTLFLWFLIIFVKLFGKGLKIINEIAV